MALVRRKTGATPLALLRVSLSNFMVWRGFMWYSTFSVYACNRLIEIVERLSRVIGRRI
jgi:hypothetical protein